MKFLNSNYGNNGYNYANFARTRRRSSANDIPITKAGDNVKYPTREPVKPMAPPTAAQLETLDNNLKAAENRKGGSKSSAPKRVRVRSGMNSNKLFRQGRVALKKAGRFAMKNKVGVGLAGAGALGAVGYGVYRKMRSDKGKKRGSYN